MRVLIGPAVCYTGVHTLAESVHQNCLLGRCANLCSIVVLHLPSLFIYFYFFFEKEILALGNLDLQPWPRVEFVTQCWYKCKI